MDYLNQVSQKYPLATYTTGSFLGMVGGYYVGYTCSTRSNNLCKNVNGIITGMFGSLSINTLIFMGGMIMSEELEKDQNQPSEEDNSETKNNSAR